MKKTLKFVWKTILWILAVVVVAVLTLPLWIGPVAKTVANRTVPGITGTAFNLGDFGFNFYTGNVRVGAVTLYNPQGYDPKEAFGLGELKVDMQVLSALSDTIVFNEIAIRDVFVSYVSKDGVNNFEAILENVQKATAGEEKEAEEPAQEPEEEKGEEKEGAKKKVIIDRFVLDGVKVQWGPVPISLPKIELDGIGRDSQGVDWDAAANEIMDAVMKQMNALGQGLIDLGGAIKDVGLDGAGKVLDAVKDVDVKGAADAVSGAADKALDAAGGAIGSAGDAIGSMTEGAGGVVGSATESAGKALGSVADGAGSAIGSAAEGTGKVLGATTDAVKDGAGKALDATTDALKGAGGAIKGLFGK